MARPQTCNAPLITLMVSMLLDQSVTSASSPTIASTSDVDIQATPITFYSGLTKHLSVTCTHHIHAGSDFSDVVSLIVSKNSVSQQNVFTEIASVTSHSRQTVDVKNSSLVADVTGGLPQTGDAFITIKFTYPTGDAEGEYKCQAFGIDNGGHPRVSSDVVEVVAEQSVTDAVLLSKIREMDKTQDELKAEFNDFKNNVTSRVNSTMAAIMAASDTYNGHTYFMSKPMVRNVAISDSLCRAFGGYLAELDTKEEFEFVYNFAITKNNGGYVTVGASDQNHNHVWKYIFSGKDITYANWWDGENNDGDCMELWVSHYGMCDEPCVDNAIRRFVCEMPY